MIWENIEKAKKYITEKKLKKALELLSVSIPESDSNTQNEIFFEMGKIFFIKKKYNKSITCLKKVHRADLKQFSYDLLFQIYVKKKENHKILNMFFKFDKKNINSYILYSALKSAYKLKKISKMLLIIGVVRANNIHDTLLEKLIKYIYKNLSEEIQKLNSDNKKEKVKSLFKSIYKYIPNEDVKFKNIILNEYEIANSKIKLNSYPRIAQVVITTKCNLRCIMCGEPNRDAKYEIPNKLFDDLIAMMPYLQKLILRGGEVFLYKNFDKILDEAYKNNVEIEILTNGLLLNESNIRQLIKINAVLNFSIDSPIKETYEIIRKDAKFDKLISNILLLNKIKKEMKSKIKFNINMVVMRTNYKEIFDMINFAKKYNFHGLNLNPITGIYSENCFSSYSEDNDVIVKELKAKRKSFQLMAKSKGISLINKLPNSISNKLSINICNKLSKNVSKFNGLDNGGDKLDSISNKLSINICNKLSKNVSKFNGLDNGGDKLGCERVKIFDNIYDRKYFENNNMQMFCYAPWRELFLDEYCCYKPNCYCSKDHKIKESNTCNTIMDLWNSNMMKEYRKNIKYGKEYKICSKQCLNNKNISYDKYRII